MQCTQYTSLCSSVVFHSISHTVITILDQSVSNFISAATDNHYFTHFCVLLQLYSLDMKLKLKTLQMHVQNLSSLSHLLKSTAEGKTDAGW